MKKRPSFSYLIIRSFKLLNSIIEIFQNIFLNILLNVRIYFFPFNKNMTMWMHCWNSLGFGKSMNMWVALKLMLHSFHENSPTNVVIAKSWCNKEEAKRINTSTSLYCWCLPLAKRNQMSRSGGTNRKYIAQLIVFE